MQSITSSQTAPTVLITGSSSGIGRAAGQRAGVIINIASVRGLTTLPFNSLYHAAPYAVVGFTEALNHELAEFGIRTKFVAPGVATDFVGRPLSTTFTDNDHP